MRSQPPHLCYLWVQCNASSIIRARLCAVCQLDLSVFYSCPPLRLINACRNQGTGQRGWGLVKGCHAYETFDGTLLIYPPGKSMIFLSLKGSYPTIRSVACALPICAYYFIYTTPYLCVGRPIRTHQCSVPRK